MKDSDFDEILIEVVHEIDHQYPMLQKTSSDSLIPSVLSNIKNRFQFGEALGYGASGRVYLTRDMKNNKLYAVKQLERCKPNAAKIFEKEVELLRKLMHPNIIQFYDCFMDKENYYIATNYCSGMLICIIYRYHVHYIF